MTMNEQQPWWSNPEQESTNTDKGKKQFRRGILGIGGAFVAVIGVMVASLLVGPNPELPKAGQWGSTMYPADVTSLIAECGDTFEFNPDEKYYGAIPDGYFSDPNSGVEVARTVPNHPMRIPAFGYFIEDENLTPEKKFFTESDRETLPPRHIFLKYMWDGWKIVWYAPDIDEDTLAAIQEYVGARDDTIAIPWFDEAAMPLDRSFSFSAWNLTRSCDKWDSDVATAFIEDADVLHKKLEGVEPPRIELEQGEDLPLIDIPE